MQSPFLLNGTLDSHFRNYTKEPPEIVEAIKDIYVDDVEGENTTAEAKELKETATEIPEDAKFQLHKWHSNVQELEQNDKQSHSSAILGVPWNKQTDSIAVKFPDQDVETTKRGILYLASIFDPLGITSPVTLVGNLIYRSICENKLGWDQQLPKDLCKMLKWWLMHLPSMLEILRSIPRLKEGSTRLNK